MTETALLKVGFKYADKTGLHIKTIVQSNPNPLGGFIINDTHCQLVADMYPTATLMEKVALIQAGLDLGVNPADPKLLMLFPSPKGFKVYSQIHLKRLLVHRYLETHPNSTRRFTPLKFSFWDGGPKQDGEIPIEKQGWYAFWIKNYNAAVVRLETKIGGEDYVLMLRWKSIQRFADKGGSWAERPDEMMCKAVESRFYDIYFADILAGTMYEPFSDDDDIASEKDMPKEPLQQATIVKEYPSELITEEVINVEPEPAYTIETPPINGQSTPHKYNKKPQPEDAEVVVPTDESEALDETSNPIIETEQPKSIETDRDEIIARLQAKKATEALSKEQKDKAKAELDAKHAKTMADMKAKIDTAPKQPNILGDE